MYLEVVFNIPVKSSFYYTLPVKKSGGPADEHADDEIKTSPGMRVSAVLGRRKLTGFVTEVFEEKPDVDFEIKPVLRIIDKQPLFSREYCNLALWLSEMYMCSPGEALFSMIPVGRNEKEFEILDIADDDKKDITLNDEQNSAVKAISESSKKHFYVYGVTGSGKTEVFLSLAEETLRQGRSVIYLVPEIALTHQLTDYVVSRFGSRLAVLHSGLTPSQKLSQWRRIQTGQADIVLGARSAVFAPVEDPGLIIIDEEHEPSYKSGSSPRYHARQVAMYRIKESGGKLVMGSATPSVEAYYLMEQKVIEKIRLHSLAAGGKFPDVQIVNMINEKLSISRQLSDEIRETCSGGGQAILFLNRRGFFYFYHCRTCGEDIKCRQCTVSLTYHKEINRLVCHYCGYSQEPDKVCPSCGSLDMGYSGFGTQKIEEDISLMFPYLKAVRLDRDTIKKSSDVKEVFQKFKNREIDILLGTQLITKGLNFPGVKLIGIIMADTSLHLPDFRSAERTFSLITQVAGRAGRFKPDGKVIIQTYNPSNYAIKFASERRFKDFYRMETENRKAMGFPPFSRVFRIIFRSKDREKAGRAAADFASLLTKSIETANDKEVLFGPAECSIFMISGNYRYHIIICALDFGATHSRVSTAAGNAKIPHNVYMEIDVDPVSLM